MAVYDALCGKTAVGLRHGITCFQLRKANGNYITVADDGVGFDPVQEKNDGKLHIGIENALSRLTVRCGGKLTVKSMVAVGAIASITIPKEEEGEC